MSEQGKFLLYTAKEGAVKVEVFFRGETVWLTQKALAELFGVKVPAINKHLKNIFETGELVEDSVISISKQLPPTERATPLGTTTWTIQSTKAEILKAESRSRVRETMRFILPPPRGSRRRRPSTAGIKDESPGDRTAEDNSSPRGRGNCIPRPRGHSCLGEPNWHGPGSCRLRSRQNR
jgi:hypothetical protein